MIKVGDPLPNVTLQEYSEVEGNGCSIGPNPVKVADAAAGKTIALFALPGAFTPTCSAKHVPGFVEKAAEFKKAGVDEIWCVSVNDAFVMGAWARDQKTGDKIRMLADGSAEFAKAAGLSAGLERSRHGHPQQSLFDAGQGRQSGDVERRGPRQVRGQRRSDLARPGQSVNGRTWPTPYRSAFK